MPRAPPSATPSTYTTHFPYSGCTANTVDQTPATNTVTNHLAPDSAAHTFATAGTWYWQAVYSGDTLNTTTTHPCTETLSAKNNPSFATTQSAHPTPDPNTAA